MLPHYLEFLAAYSDLIHGAIMVLILLFLPQGFVTAWCLVRLRLARRRLGQAKDREGLIFPRNSKIETNGMPNSSEQALLQISGQTKHYGGRLIAQRPPKLCAATPYSWEPNWAA